MKYERAFYDIIIYVPEHYSYDVRIRRPVLSKDIVRVRDYDQLWSDQWYRLISKNEIISESATVKWMKPKDPQIMFNSIQLAINEYWILNFAHEDIVTMRNINSNMDQNLIFIIYHYTLNYTGVISCCNSDNIQNSR